MSESSKMLGLLEPLHKAVSKKFETAYQKKNLVFSDTKLAHLKTKTGPTFQLRYCPALAHKPKGNQKEAKDSKGPKFDPFADPPAELLVARIPAHHASHFLVLNKFPVIHNHFIIATTANKPQTDLLEMNDLQMTHACLRAWQFHENDGSSKRLFAFFNSGEHSGASQVHRHLQFLPVEDMSESEPGPWDLLIDRMTTRAHPELPLFHDPGLPFLHFSTPLETESSSTDLLSKYLLLLRAAMSATQSPSQPLNQEIAIEENGQTTFSYNLGMTRERMAICPRKSEAVGVPGAGPESSVALNGTILAGTLMVKHEAEWNTLQETPSLLSDMLVSIGYPPTTWM
ncbi:ATP adenylyltransferase [Exophiala viscosa]|uniref:ATP adenylyltransferase n=1 Tax=Exophiala viscosa TaxID=2486360 RepID=A0AAN6E7U1_9EURO|nr:ATP adenylyltransferase [Exophiala viscosa]